MEGQKDCEESWGLFVHRSEPGRKGLNYWDQCDSKYLGWVEQGWVRESCEKRVSWCRPALPSEAGQTPPAEGSQHP